MRYHIYKTRKGYMLYDSKNNKLLMRIVEPMDSVILFKSIKLLFDELTIENTRFTSVQFSREEFSNANGTPFVELDVLDYDYIVQNYPHLLII